MGWMPGSGFNGSLSAMIYRSLQREQPLQDFVAILFLLTSQGIGTREALVGAVEERHVHTKPRRVQYPRIIHLQYVDLMGNGAVGFERRSGPHVQCARHPLGSRRGRPRSVHAMGQHGFHVWADVERRMPQHGARFALSNNHVALETDSQRRRVHDS